MPFLCAEVCPIYVRVVTSWSQRNRNLMPDAKKYGLRRSQRRCVRRAIVMPQSTQDHYNLNPESPTSLLVPQIRGTWRRAQPSFAPNTPWLDPGLLVGPATPSNVADVGGPL